MERETKVERQPERTPAKVRESASPAPRTTHPLLVLQEHAGNQAVSAMVGRRLAVTEDGRTTFDPQALTHPRFPEIAAHEAVRRAQFQAAGKPVGTVRQMEHDAIAGTRSLLAGKPHNPAFRALPGASLGWVPGSIPGPDDSGSIVTDNLASLERVGPGASKTGTVETKTTQEGAFDSKQTTTYHWQVKGEGSRGSVDSTTDLIIVVNPKDPLLTGPAKDPELKIIHTTEPATAYPVMLSTSGPFT